MYDFTRRQSLVLGIGAASAAVLAGNGAMAAVPADGKSASTSGYAHPNWLVSADWLQRHLGRPTIKIVALTSEASFTAAHIPGAAQVNWPALGLTDTTPSAIAAWQKTMRAKLTELGISSHDTVVTYDGGTLFAARLWWVLDHLGQPDKRILNGGLPAWIAANGRTDGGASAVRPAEVQYRGHPNPADLATLEEVKASFGKSDVVLIDVRPAAEYVRGHIPGAINILYLRNALPDPPRFWKPASALRQLYAGIPRDKEIIAYCNTGVMSSVTFFTLRLIGYPNVRLYTGSWAEWSRHPDLPKVIGDRP